MATIIIALLIALAVFMGLRSFIKGKGSCGDCNCSCPVKDSQHKNVKVKYEKRYLLIWAGIFLLYFYRIF